MTESYGFIIEFRKTDALDEGRQFCNIVIRGVRGEIIGDPESWTVIELMISSIEDMLQLLKLQTFDPALAGPAPEVFDTLRTMREDFPKMEARYFALPRSVECFDGEMAYLMRQGSGAARFVWRDYISQHIIEREVSFDQYLIDWEGVLSSCR